MKKLFATLAAAAALTVGGASHADVLNFNDPSAAIEIGAGSATYTESGFMLSGPSVPFALIDEMLIGGFVIDPDAPAGSTTSFSLTAVSGGVFSLLSFDYAFFAFGDPDAVASGSLSVTGLLNGAQVASQVFTLGTSASPAFGSDFANLTSVTFNGTSLFSLDNIAVTPVPEPATVVLTGLGLLGVALATRRRQRSA